MLSRTCEGSPLAFCTPHSLSWRGDHKALRLWSQMNRCVVLETSTALQQGTDQSVTTSQRVVSCLMCKVFYQNQRCIILFNIMTTLFCFFNFFLTSEQMSTGCLSGSRAQVCQRLHLHAAGEATGSAFQLLQLKWVHILGMLAVNHKENKNMLQGFRRGRQTVALLLSSLRWSS